MKEKWIELLKWFIGSVVIVVVTLIIDTGFKEREAGIKEMEVYDKYVDIILKADNIEQRWKLCEYFSIVTPTERLRLRWQAYRDTISEDYYKWKALKSDSNLESSLDDSPLVTKEPLLQKQSFYEERGFNSIIERDFQTSLESFLKAEQIHPGYHNCYEISKYLKQNETSLLSKDSPGWKVFYGELLTKWSWGMPNQYKEKLQELAK